MNKLSKVLLFVVTFGFAGLALAQTLAICHGEYALCAASPATPTGKTITVNGTVFQEGVAVCPVLKGKSIANLDLMQGSCRSGPGKVWSLFSTVTTFPQAPTWESVPAVHRTFVTTAGAGGMSNMWSFECVKQPNKVNGVELANCYGPLNESAWNSKAVPVGATVVTDAPVGATYPVGGPIPSGSSK
jgi:hypothetical protein